MKQEGKYLYCIIKGKQLQKFGIAGIEGKEVYAISAGELSAVVSDSEIKEYFLTRDNLLAHQKVIEEVSRHYDVLPVSFGIVARNSEDVKQRMLKLKAKELKEALKEISGKIELGLKVFWNDMASVFREIAQNQNIKSLKKSKNLSYRDKIAAGELAGKLLKEKREQEKEKILEPLKKIAEDFKENQTLGDEMILNFAFLVKKNREKNFDETVNNLGKKYGEAVKFIYVGPLPPFNFVKLSLSL